MKNSLNDIYNQHLSGKYKGPQSSGVETQFTFKRTSEPSEFMV